MGRIIIFAGILLILVGIIVTVVQKYIGKLPGDFVFQKGNFTFYFPFMTMLIVSICITIVLNILLKFFR